MPERFVMFNWTELLNNKTATRLVQEFVRGNINRDSMIRFVPELRSEIRTKGVSRVKNMGRKALSRRSLNV